MAVSYTHLDVYKRQAQKTGVSMPITSELYHVLYEGGDVHRGIAALMGRSKKDEHESETTWLT